MDADDDYVTVAHVADVPSGTASTVVVGSREIALFNVAGTFYALDNTCPHQGGPLVEGWIDGTRVTCPWHAWTFELTNGKMTLGDYATVDVFDVRVVGEAIRVRRKPRES